ncbi:MAG: hypothetical protein LH650_04750, partial [Chloroflexi bacterium]|nr:hypothetical protein [Chloroflexota bacterium]
VPAGSGHRFPGFQFDGSGRPLPVIADVIGTLGAVLSGWELALWFTSPHPDLQDQRPADVLRDAPDRVRGAAAFTAGQAEWW